MRILVLSDSHSAMSFMRRCVSIMQPDVIIHLGDYFDDGLALHEEFPDIMFFQVPGNCDSFLAPVSSAQIMIQRLEGVDIYMTHGHLHCVKENIEKLVAAAKENQCGAVLYGHTHRAQCFQDESGLWVLNPGSCGYGGGSAGWMELADGKILECSVLRESDLMSHT